MLPSKTAVPWLCSCGRRLAPPSLDDTHCRLPHLLGPANLGLLQTMNKGTQQRCTKQPWDDLSSAMLNRAECILCAINKVSVGHDVTPCGVQHSAVNHQAWCFMKSEQNRFKPQHMLYQCKGMISKAPPEHQLSWQQQQQQTDEP